MCFTAKCYTNAAFVAFVIKNQYWCVSRNKNGSDGGGRMGEVRCFAVLCSKPQSKHVWLHVAAFMRCLQIYDTAARSISPSRWCCGGPCC